MKMSAMAAAIPLGLFCFGLGRLLNRRRQFEGCLHNLSKIIKNGKLPTAMALRMTDREIRAFSKWDPIDIQQYIEENRTQSLRWRMIFHAYLKSNGQERT